MAIDQYTYNHLLELRQKFPNGETALILGDCHFFVKDYPLDNREALEKFKKTMGFKKIYTVDLTGNPSLVHDLQLPFEAEFQNYFDWVIDAGVLFWCFDLASVLSNILNILKDSGYIYHLSALTGHFGRGYYSLQPAFFKDFYEANGFELLNMSVRTPKLNTGMAKILHKMYKLIGKDTLAYNRININDVYLETGGLRSLKFSKKLQMPRTSILPVDSLISCFVYRQDKQVFRKPIRMIA